MYSVARPRRTNISGAYYHVRARGVEKRAIFLDDVDRQRFLAILAQLRREWRFRVLAFCLMNNHFHLAIRSDDIRLSRIMHRLMSTYANWFNRRRERTGHLFEGRFKDKPCLNDEYLATLINYIHDNPVRAKMVLKQEDWPWSSRRTFESGRDDGIASPRNLPEAFSLEAAVPNDFDPWSGGAPLDPVLTPRKPQDLDSIASEIAARSGISVPKLKSGRSAARREFVAHSIERGLTLREIADWLGISPSTVCYLSKSRNSN